MSRPPVLNLFYEEPDPDRWVPYDRYPRRLLRSFVHGRAQPGGAMRAFLNLRAGLDLIGAAYRVNDYRRLESAGRGELVCLFGKPHVLEKIPKESPILFGTSIYSHPIDNPDLLEFRAIRRVLVPSVWVQQMFAVVWPDRVSVWPVGIDTRRWSPAPDRDKDVDVLIYDKITWAREHYERLLLDPLLRELARRALRVEILKYGHYREEELLALSKRARAMVYLSRHETQGIAAQQMLAAGVPLFAWDEGGFWQDPKYFPHLVKFKPVTSVPYWDSRCGEKFNSTGDLLDAFDAFWREVTKGRYSPRLTILERLTLERCARDYVDLAATYA
jgi:glycosyltransferase involved in cell wall biosynthesis